MSTVVGQVVIKRTRYGDTITTRLESNKALYQAIEDQSNLVAPDWTVVANQPTITPMISSSVKDGAVPIEGGTIKWKYNAQQLIFDSSGNCTGCIGGSTGAGLFKLNITTGALTIVGNLASATNTNVDNLRFEAIVNTGYQTPVGADVDVRIEKVGKNSYTGVVDTNFKTLKEGEVDTITATARLSLGVTDAPTFKTEWKKGTATHKAKSTDKTCNITRADVEGSQLFICNFYVVIDGTDKLVSSYMFIIYDSSDPYYVQLSPTSNMEVSDLNTSSAWVAKLRKRIDNTEVSTGVTWTFQAYNCRADLITLATTPSATGFTVTTADCDRKETGKSYENGDITVSATATITI